MTQELIEKLRSMNAVAPDESIIPTLLVFGIQNASALRQYSVSDIANISVSAGLKGGHAFEIRKGVNLSKHVELRNGNSSERIESAPHISLHDLTDDFRSVHADAPKGALVVCSLLFGIKNAGRLQRYQFADLKQLSLAAGAKAEYASEIRKGMRLVEYVGFKSYPSKKYCN